MASVWQHRLFPECSDTRLPVLDTAPTLCMVNLRIDRPHNHAHLTFLALLKTLSVKYCSWPLPWAPLWRIAVLRYYPELNMKRKESLGKLVSLADLLLHMKSILDWIESPYEDLVSLFGWDWSEQDVLDCYQQLYFMKLKNLTKSPFYIKSLVSLAATRSSVSACKEQGVRDCFGELHTSCLLSPHSHSLWQVRCV